MRLAVRPRAGDSRHALASRATSVASVRSVFHVQPNLLRWPRRRRRPRHHLLLIFFLEPPPPRCRSYRRVTRVSRLCACELVSAPVSSQPPSMSCQASCQASLWTLLHATSAIQRVVVLVVGPISRRSRRSGLGTSYLCLATATRTWPLGSLFHFHLPSLPSRHGGLCIAVDASRGTAWAPLAAESAAAPASRSPPRRLSGAAESHADTAAGQVAWAGAAAAAEQEQGP